jgi:hypothetical protein
MLAEVEDSQRTEDGRSLFMGSPRDRDRDDQRYHMFRFNFRWKYLLYFSSYPYLIAFQNPLLPTWKEWRFCRVRQSFQAGVLYITRGAALVD